jgi:8-oxo-dGTP diphosphatase
MAVEDSQMRDWLGLTAEEALARLDGTATRVVVGAAVTTAGDASTVLLVSRVGDDEYGGIEELPSGAVEAGESLGDALAREVREETGLAAQSTGEFLFSFYYDSRKGRTIQLNYQVTVGPAPRVVVDPQEHDGYRWVPVLELGQTRLTPQVRAGLNRLSAMENGDDPEDRMPDGFQGRESRA